MRINNLKNILNSNRCSVCRHNLDWTKPRVHGTFKGKTYTVHEECEQYLDVQLPNNVNPYWYFMSVKRNKLEEKV